jgi:hypothetical protein
MSLDPKGKYLRQEETGVIYVWSETLAKRADMREFDPVRMKLATDLNPTPKKPLRDDVSIELQGETFLVSPKLKEIIDDLLKFTEELKSKNETLTGLLSDATEPVEVSSAKETVGESKQGPEAKTPSKTNIKRK